ncbi:MAG: YtxH domain-containing protein [Cyanobacteriota bacterium]
MTNLNNINSYSVDINGIKDKIRFTNKGSNENHVEIKAINSLSEIKNDGKDNLVVKYKDGIIAYSADKIEIAHGVFKQDKVVPQKGDTIKMFSDDLFGKSTQDEGILVSIDIESEKPSINKESSKSSNIDLKGSIKSSGEKTRDVIDKGSDKLKDLTNSKDFKDAKKEAHSIADKISDKANEIKDQLIPKDIQKDIKGISDKIDKLKDDVTKNVDHSIQNSLSKEDKKSYNELKKQTDKTSNKIKDSFKDIFK